MDIGHDRKRSAPALWAKGLRMEARRAKTWRSQGLVYDSRTPIGGWPKAGILQIAVGLWGRKTANRLANQALYHFRVWP